MRFRTRGTWLAGALIALLMTGCGWKSEPRLSPPAAAPVLVTMPDFRGIVKTAAPAVVNVVVAGQPRTTESEETPLDPQDPFSQFFRKFQPQGKAPARGLGSGVIVRPDGIILTNAHVVENALSVTVKLADKREFQATVVGLDKPTDIAVLKIEAAALPTAPLGDPSRTETGDWLIAIGSPYGFENSVTAGIVSAKARSIPEEGYVPFIQTDVAVNPGNSGGPLLNVQGEVVGINAQIYTRTGGYQGLSFAIPIDVAMKVAEHLLRDGKVIRGRLGVGIQEVSQSLGVAFGLTPPRGALVATVDASGPAAQAGLKPGDIVLSLNGETLRDSRELAPWVADLKVGAVAKLGIWRDHHGMDVAVTIGELAATGDAAPVHGEKAPPGRLGIKARPLNKKERQVSKLKEGLVIEQAGGAAERSGLVPGDVILAVNGQPVDHPAQLHALAGQAGSALALLVMHGMTTLYVPVNLD